MKFTIKSNYYKYLLLTSVVIFILIDLLSLVSIYQSLHVLPASKVTLSLFAVAVRLCALLCLLMSRGPLLVCLYVWGASMVVGGAAGVLSIGLFSNFQPISIFIKNLFFLTLGLLIIIPARKQIIPVSEE